MTRNILIYLLAEVQTETDFSVDASRPKQLGRTEVWDSFEKSCEGQLASVWLQM